MQVITLGAHATMTSREIADLIEKQHSHIKVSAERLAEKGVIGTLAPREFTHNGNDQQYKGMVKVRDFPRYAVDEEGGVYSMYFVGRTGRVIQRPFPIRLSIAVDSYGYGVVTLYSESEKRTCKVHRLIAEAFFEANPERPHVNHKNGQKLDNRAANLEWCTPSENQIHSYHTLHTKPNKPWLGKSNASKSIAITVRDCSSGALSQFPSIKSFCSAVGVSRATVFKRIDTGIPAKGMLICKAYHASVWREAYALDIAADPIAKAEKAEA